MFLDLLENFEEVFKICKSKNDRRNTTFVHWPKEDGEMTNKRSTTQIPLKTVDEVRCSGTYFMNRKLKQ